MLDEAVRGERVDKSTYEAALPQLRVDLLNAQYDLRSAPFAAVVVVAGDDRGGANDTVNILHEWMDSRYLDTTVFRELTQDELERPRFWRTWMALPAKGRTGIWAGGVLRVINHRLDGNINDNELEGFARHLQRMRAELVADGTLVLKLWFHLPRAEHERRLKKAKRNPRLGWRVDELDWVVSGRLPAATPLIERFLRETELPGLPWDVIDGTSWRSRNLTTGQLLRDAMVGALATHPCHGGRRLQGHPNCSADGGGAEVPLSLAVLEPPAPRRPDGDHGPADVHRRGALDPGPGQRQAIRTARRARDRGRRAGGARATEEEAEAGLRTGPAGRRCGLPAPQPARTEPRWRW